jgi:hypothetical protein
MTAQESFHNFFSRTGGGPLRRVVLVALVDDLDLLAEIVSFVSRGPLREGRGLAHEVRLARERGFRKGAASVVLCVEPEFVDKQPAETTVNSRDRAESAQGLTVSPRSSCDARCDVTPSNDAVRWRSIQADTGLAIARKSLTVITFIVRGRWRSISRRLTVNRRVAGSSPARGASP